MDRSPRAVATKTHLAIHGDQKTTSLRFVAYAAPYSSSLSDLYRKRSLDAVFDDDGFQSSFHLAHTAFYTVDLDCGGGLGDMDVSPSLLVALSIPLQAKSTMQKGRI